MKKANRFSLPLEFLAITRILLWLFIFAAVGCVSRPGMYSPVEGQSILQKAGSAAHFNSVANSLSSDPWQRARAVFGLFANNVQPGHTAIDLKKTIADPVWFDRSDIAKIRALAGWIPVDDSLEDSVFVIRLFPKQLSGWYAWDIYLRLAGSKLGEEDAIAFLRGDLRRETQLVEFALCFPSSRPGKLGRIERFTGDKILVYTFY